jgi:hypothetical protein
MQGEFFQGAEPAPGVVLPESQDETGPTPALRRVLEKARDRGVVRRAGIYSDVSQGDVADEPEFDWQHAIDRAIALGWLAPGVAFNTYALTAAGQAALALAPPPGAEAQQQAWN